MKARLGLAFVLVLLLPFLAYRDSSYELCFRSRTNGERTSRGISALEVDARIDKIARDHSDEMAERGTIFHNEHLPEDLPSYEYGGENVGMGPSCDAIQEAFMSSPGHKANILDRDYRFVGVGVTYDSAKGTLFVTLDFWTPKTVSKPAAKPSIRPTVRASCSCR